MSFVTGNKYKLSIFGTSHGKGVGVVIDSPPAGFALDMKNLKIFMAKRAPVSTSLGTKRAEDDEFEILSGISNGYTNGSPMCIFIKNKDASPSDYDMERLVPRPSHADYVSYLKYGGFHDKSGGGHFSGRLTAPLAAAGAIALQILKALGISIYSHLYAVMDIQDVPFNSAGLSDIQALDSKKIPFIDDRLCSRLTDLIETLRTKNDSAGGTIETIILGLKPGIGAPMFDTVEGRLANMLFSVPGVRGVEFGSGFGCCKMLGSEHNDPLAVKNGKLVTLTNNAAGINGGITNGMPIIMRTAVKPAASIGVRQQSVDLKTLKDAQLVISGRHDPFIALRAVPVVSAAAAAVMLDLIMDNI